MRVISLKVLQAFWEEHQDSKEALRDWYRVAQDADWQSIADVRRIYPHADAVATKKGGTLTVFNIGGNKYRLIARIRYDWKLVNLRAVLTHADYDKGKWKE